MVQEEQEGPGYKYHEHMGDCQNYGPFLGPYYNTGPNLGDPKRDYNFDNPQPKPLRSLNLPKLTLD